MARQLIPLVHLNRFTAQADPTPQSGDVVNGHYVPNDGATGLYLLSSAGSITVSVVIPGGVDQNLVSPVRTYTVGTTTLRTGAFPRNVYGDLLLVNVSSANARLLAYSLV